MLTLEVNDKLEKPDLRVCNNGQAIFKDDRYWCLVEKPEDCPFTSHFNDAFECVHPEHVFFKKKRKLKK